MLTTLPSSLLALLFAQRFYAVSFSPVHSAVCVDAIHFHSLSLEHTFMARSS